MACPNQRAVNRPGSRFSEADQQLLSTSASAVGVAFHNARLCEDAGQARAAAEEADAAKKNPLLSTVLGVLSIQSFKKNAYTEGHLSLLENLAAYTTIALDNANAYQVINEQEHSFREARRSL